MQLVEFNQLAQQEALKLLLQCCTSEQWATRLLAMRPFADLPHLQQNALSCWQQLAETDYLQAFDGHPKIGDINSLKAKYANTAQLAGHEQSSVQQASEHVLQRLTELNQNYATKFGFIFIVFASGKSAAQMLALLESRINNSRAQELQLAALEQSKIFALRLTKLFQ
jgi:2-oxo-4-hydroxy-4-carboxy-5-ureidoimidazoline decarboxylase